MPGYSNITAGMRESARAYRAAHPKMSAWMVRAGWTYDANGNPTPPARRTAERIEYPGADPEYDPRVR